MFGSKLFTGLALFTLLLAPAARLSAAKETWDPIDPADRAATECKAYPGAHAEVLIDRLVLDTAGDSQVEKHYIRYKLYSQKGVEDTGNYEIVYPSRQDVWNLAARVIKPDGTAKEYDKKSFNESIVARLGDKKFKRLAIAVPGLAPGDILEMHWSQSVEVEDYRVRWWYCQSTLPVREFVFAVAASTNDFSMQVFNVADAKVDNNSRSSGKLTCRNLPPFEEEPNMPPMQDVRGWFMMIYTDPYYQRFYSGKDEFWKALSQYMEEDFRLETKPNAAIKAKAAELTAGLTADDAKLAALYEFCRAQISNIDFFSDAKLLAVKKKIEDNEGQQSPAKTLQVGAGRSRHVNELFAALAKAAGYKVTAAECASRRHTLNVRHKNGYPFLNDLFIIVDVAGTKRYFSPGDYYVPPGLVHPSNEAAPMLVFDESKVLFEKMPVAPADKSPIHRKGRFSLDTEGNLEGEVEIAYGGHAGARRKLSWHGDTLAEVESDYREQITKRLPAAEVTELKFENLTGITLPLIVRYHLKVPGYADLAGDKIIFAPGVFEHGSPAVFSSEKRAFAVFFTHAYTENDDIEIVAPEGYILDAGSAPRNVGKPDAAIGTQYQIGFRPKAHTLHYKRGFTLGAGGEVLFQAASYPAIKRIFDLTNHSDEHTLVLKPAPADVPAAAAPAASATP